MTRAKQPIYARRTRIPKLLAIALFIAAASAPTAAARPWVGVDGERLVDRQGNTVRLLGVNRSGTEYACAQGWGFFDSPTFNEADSAEMVQAIRDWGANAVRVPLNEACWLETNGVAPERGGAEYRAVIATYVQRLQAAGMFAILDLHVVAPKDFPADLATQGLRPAPDAGRAVKFWRSVARRFGGNRGVVFDLYNEPNGITWECLRDGCRITDDLFRDDVPNYRSAGMQQLVDAIRAEGAQNVLLVPGIDFANNISAWTTWAPVDPLGRLAASFHNYEGHLGSCHAGCWDEQVTPVAAATPVVSGEIGDVDCNHDYIDSYMSWADDHGVSYLGWTWNATEFGYWDCSEGPALIVTYAGTPTDYGVGLRDHLLGL